MVGARLGERVRRLLEPAHRPVLRLPWPTLLLVVVAFFGMMRLLGTGLELAVGVVLDGPQHVAALQEIEREFDQSEPVAGEVNAGDARVTVAGVVHTHDGEPVPTDYSFALITKSGKGTTFAGHSLQEDGSFRLAREQPGTITKKSTH